jgi:hypothetical protein
MVQITIEYMILTPVLIMLIFLLPFTANAAMNTYVNSRQTLELQKVAGHLGSAIQQVYFSLNHGTIAAGTISSDTEVPPLLEGYRFTLNCTSRLALESGATIVDLKLKLSGSGATINTSVTLGQNVEWADSYFWSDSPTACITATKYSNNTIKLSIKP